jgi:hypothetical protein
MRAKLIALGAVVAAFGIGPAGTAFAADADQTASNKATAGSDNTSSTTQGAGQTQSSSSDCHYGCGGSGQSQFLLQDAETDQKAESEANADQTGVNANVPVTISAGDVHGGNNSATQDLSNKAEAESENTSTTDQGAGQTQSSSSDCKAGCGGSGQSQKLGQFADTWQGAFSKANADQTGVNANVPVTISAGDVKGGNNSATQHADNKATAESSNDSTTEQGAGQSQSSDSGSDCKGGCGGSGQSQKLEQSAHTWQKSFSWANAWQELENANTPVTVSKGKKAKKGKHARKAKKDKKADHHAKD